MNATPVRQARRWDGCANMNHKRGDAPVGYCPDCGGVVNERLRSGRCSDREHDVARRGRMAFCVRCGTQLIDAR